MTIFDNSYNINRLIIESKRLNPDKYAIIYQNLIIEAKRIAPDKYAIIIQKAYKRFRCNILYRKKFIEQYEMLDNFKKHIFIKDKSIECKKNFRSYLQELWNSYNAYIPCDLQGVSMAHCFARYIFAYVIPVCESEDNNDYLNRVTRIETIKLMNSNGLDYYLNNNNPKTGCFHPEMREMQNRLILRMFKTMQLDILNSLYAISNFISGIRGYGYYLFQVNGRHTSYLEPKRNHNYFHHYCCSDTDKEDFTWCFCKKDNMINHDFIHDLVKVVNGIDDDRFWGWNFRTLK